MSSLRKGNNENRKSIFYTTEEWELLDPTPKDLEDSMALEEKRKPVAEGSKGTSGRREGQHTPYLLYYSVLCCGDLQEISENLDFLPKPHLELCK